ncbi:MAG: hypothetical protein ACTSXT_15135 [Candidatus Helarchaeota archaeon]
MGTLMIDMFMGIPRGFEIGIYLICSIIIYKKQNYFLNKIYSVSLIGWTVYALCDLLIFPIGHIEPWSLGEISIHGEMMTVPLIANILRDIQIFGAAIMAFGYLYASIIIRYGASKAKEKKYIITIILLIASITLVMDAFDTIIKDTSVIPDVVKTNYTMMSFIFILIELTLYFFAIYEHARVYKDINKDKIDKRKILYFIFGSATTAIGVLYFVIIGILISGQEYQLITGPIGHMIWIMSPLFIYWGFKNSKVH